MSTTQQISVRTTPVEFAYAKFTAILDKIEIEGCTVRTLGDRVIVHRLLSYDIRPLVPYILRPFVDFTHIYTDEVIAVTPTKMVARSVINLGSAMGVEMFTLENGIVTIELSVCTSYPKIFNDYCLKGMMKRRIESITYDGECVSGKVFTDLSPAVPRILWNTEITVNFPPDTPAVPGAPEHGGVTTANPAKKSTN